ncbi:MAG: DUF4388 domain-containing protein [Deltaproteobacteria bacterium]|nr:MAG: DUF4388 domain-containing protein [Deltaproteobacteria bacterium]
MTKAKWTDKGDLLLPAEVVKQFKQQGMKPRLLKLGDSLLVCPHPQPGRRKSSLLYGDLKLFSIAELLALISSLRASGTLTILIPHAKKTITFRDGQVVYATSTVEDDRLGETLWRRGIITLQQLSSVYDKVRPGRKLGRILLEEQIIGPQQLYEGIKAQVEEIVLSAFYLERGEFLFIESHTALKDAVRLDKTTRQLIGEGLRRLQEHNRLENFIPDEDQVLVRRQVELKEQLDPRQQQMLELIDGQRTVREIIDESRLVEKTALEVLADLNRLGLVDSRDASFPSSSRQLGLAFERYRGLLQVVYMALEAENPEFTKRLEAYLGNPPPRFASLFRSVGFDSDGRLDIDTLYRNARHAATKLDARRLALEALQSFYDYARFQAMDLLEDETCDEMIAKLQQLEQRLADVGPK